MNHIFIIMAIALIEMATDMYLPNLPMVLKEFQSTEAILQLTLSLNLLGLASAGLLGGPLSDTFGRRNTLLIGLLLFIVGGIGCCLAPSVPMLMGARLLQGLGGGIVLVVGTASMRDIFQGDKLAQMMSMMGMVIAISPGLAPLMGGYIGLHFGWRATFGFLVITGLLLMLIIAIAMPETLKRLDRKPFSMGHLIQSYAAVFRIKPFLINSFLLGLTIAQLWVEMGNLPFIFIQSLGVPSHQYGLYFGSGVGIFILGTLFNQRYVLSLGSQKLLYIGIGLKVLSVLLLCGAAFLSFSQAWIIQLLIYPGSFGLALVIGNASGQCLSAVDEHVGAASAILYLLEMALAAGALYLAGLFFDGTLWPIAISGIIWVALVSGIIYQQIKGREC